ncbi:beta-1,6-N-acetylglucosaminyltransferase [Arsenicicoccus sp. oral taxon 190]|uniref:beta-1,6-N-acetylglucosaminyltransferase n=1 Tax=Arsenicicoccus sp. oral taxon 190 TaxID=1658671 RepID=UPI00067A12B0|nr:beta-1,6-N-acetylglucosaminyltransferase [Arsenicicoccus sp. oral taxon 190]AKT52358.1 hypothetical protein ADJ73_15690 [Arsenicicoccus sp. oral taxon 190]
MRRIRHLSPEAAVLVRYSSAAALDRAVLEEAGAAVLVSDIATWWGDWSLVDAELECYETALRLVDPDHVVLVSGQDYPITDLRAWEQQVAQRGADAMLALHDPDPVTVDNRWRIVRGPALPGPVHRAAVAVAWRITLAARGRLYLNDSPKRADHRWWIGVPRRGERRPVRKASQWKVLSRHAVEVLLQHYRQDPQERAFFASCKVPDELYVASTLTAAGVDVVAAPTTFAHFPEDGSSPEYLTREHVREAVAAGSPFARKLHPDADPEVLAALDAAAGR